MALILEYREKIQKFYRTNAVVILPVLKFLLAFISLNGVNTMMGYMPKLDTLTIVLMASLACSFLPAGCLILLCALFSLGHLYALSLEALLIGGCVYLLIFLLMLRFAPSDSYVVILTPLFFAMKIPYVIPIAVGLLCSPLSAISVACGAIIYYVLKLFVDSAPTYSAIDAKDITEKLRFLIELLLKNKAMLVVAGAFGITVVIVWFIRRLSIEHSWLIAIVAGAMINLVMLLVGDMIYDVNLSLGSAIFGSILAVLVALVILFFRFCVDYGRTEYVQFEDDDYYYYVKAVPKMTVAAPTKTVKKINTNSQSIPHIPDKTARPKERRRPSDGQTSGTTRNAQGQQPAASRTAQGQQSGATRPTQGQSSGASRTAKPTQRPQAATKSVNFVAPPQEPVYEEDVMGQTRAIPQTNVDAAPKAKVSAKSGSSGRGSSRQSITPATEKRTVTTERVPRSDGQTRKQGNLPTGVTVGSDQMTQEATKTDDYEELF
ncbi:MAG: hypothetical protein J6Q02_05825 [Lachnospiraceae bacterium]|nr:hypothetical protein [Lachnospiraceae bacterium]